MAIRKKDTLPLPESAIFELEDLLYEPQFLGVPIGATLADLLLSMFSICGRPRGLSGTIKSCLAWWRFCWRGPRNREVFPQLEIGRFLLTWLADTPRLNEFILPVIEELGPEQCNVIGGAPAIRKRLTSDVGFCCLNQSVGIDLYEWRKEYGRCRTDWHKKIRGWLTRHRQSPRFFPQLAFALAVRTFYVASYIRLLDRIQPSVVITESEHNFPWSCLILASRLRGIPTVQMVHGVLYPSFTVVPLLSDVSLCWGDQQREQMIDLGTDRGRVVVTGCQRLSRATRVDGQAVRIRLDLPLKTPVVMLATSPMPRAEWRKLVFTFGDAFQVQPCPVSVVKLHPSETRDNYQEEILRYPHVRFLESSEWTVEESMAVCDVVVIHNSGLGNDALVMERPVVIIDALTAPLSNGLELADKAGCPIVHNAVELLTTVNAILHNSTYRLALKKQAQVYVKRFCYAFGRDAARNVANEVRKRSKKKYNATLQAGDFI